MYPFLSIFWYPTNPILGICHMGRGISPRPTQQAYGCLTYLLSAESKKRQQQIPGLGMLRHWWFQLALLAIWSHSCCFTIQRCSNSMPLNHYNACWLIVHPIYWLPFHVFALPLSVITCHLLFSIFWKHTWRNPPFILNRFITLQPHPTIDYRYIMNIHELAWYIHHKL